MEKLNTSALMGKGPLDCVATKDKGRATITAIKYSAPDRVIFFSFYNHPQLLWVWVDRTSISPRKLNLYVDVGGRLKASIKGEGSKPKKGGTMVKNWSHPGCAEKKVFSDTLSSPLCNHHEHHDKQLSVHQSLAF